MTVATRVRRGKRIPGNNEGGLRGEGGESRDTKKAFSGR